MGLCKNAKCLSHEAADTSHRLEDQDKQDPRRGGNKNVNTRKARSATRYDANAQKNVEINSVT